MSSESPVSASLAEPLLQPLKESTMNVNLARYIIDAVDRYWAEDVQILGAWQDGPAEVCVVPPNLDDPWVQARVSCKLSRRHH